MMSFVLSSPYRQKAHFAQLTPGALLGKNAWSEGEADRERP